jgi:hypothetical protein
MTDSYIFVIFVSYKRGSEQNGSELNAGGRLLVGE